MIYNTKLFVFKCIFQVLGGGGDHAINSKKVKFLSCANNFFEIICRDQLWTAQVDVKRAKAKPGKIFVGGLVPELEDEQIKIYFAQFGTVTDCEMPFDKTKNQRKNFCFVTFEREETMKDLLKSPKQKIGEVEVDVKRATPKSGSRSSKIKTFPCFRIPRWRWLWWRLLW